MMINSPSRRPGDLLKLLPNSSLIRLVPVGHSFVFSDCHICLFISIDRRFPVIPGPLRALARANAGRKKLINSALARTLNMQINTILPFQLMLSINIPAIRCLRKVNHTVDRLWESQRDSISQPRVARRALPWVNVPTFRFNPEGIESSVRCEANGCNPVRARGARVCAAFGKICARGKV